MKKRNCMILFCLMLAASVSGCGPKKEDAPLVVVEQDQEEVTYEFGAASYEDVVLTKRIKCVYRQMKDQEVSFSVSGKRIDKIFVEKGDTVKKGDLLARLSGGNLDEQIERLEYSIKRNEMLIKHNDTNEDLDLSQRWVTAVYHNGKGHLEEDLENIKKNYRYQQEDLEDAIALDKLELQKLKAERSASFVYAEMDGVIYQMEDYLEGATSQKDKKIMTIIDTSECLFETEEPAYNVYYKNGDIIPMNISTTTAAGDYELVPWHIEEWGDKQYFSVYTGPDNDGIEVGTSGYMILTMEKREQVLSVPIEAVYKAGDQYYVYVNGNDNMREVRWITIGVYGDSRVEVKEGLSEGEKVILK